MNLIDTILFDWDGTLIDSARRAFDAFVRQLNAFGIRISLETYERIYSPNWYSMYAEVGLPQEKWKEADDLWLQFYGSEEPKSLPGVPGLLDELAAMKYALGLVTSGTRQRVLREIRELGFEHKFQSVVCCEDVANMKPHPEGLELAIRQMGKSRNVCCYVGDSPDDIEMGKRSGVVTIGIAGRYPTSRKLADSHPDLMLDSLGQLLERLSEDKAIFNRRIEKV